MYTVAACSSCNFRIGADDKLSKWAVSMRKCKISQWSFVLDCNVFVSLLFLRLL